MIRDRTQAGAAGTRWSIALTALLPAIFAVWLYWPVRNGGLLLDDLPLVGYLLEPGADGLQLSWRRVAADFAGPWAFLNGDYYRPLATLSLAIDHWLSGGAEWMQHWTAIALFAACGFSVAVLAGVLSGPLAAAAAGLFFVAHPAGHEPVCWPCTRADLLVLNAGIWSCVAFVRYVRQDRGMCLGWVHATAVLALLAKETALLLPVWFVLLDLAGRDRPVPWRQRLRPHLSLVPVWLLYLGWRWLILGKLLGTSGLQPRDAVAHWFTALRSQLQACMAPAGNLLPASTPLAVGLLAGWVLLGGMAWRTNRRWTAVLVVWLLVSLLPAKWFVVAPDLYQSRVVSPALLGPSLLVGVVLGGPACARWFRGVGAVLLAVAAVHLALGSRAIQAAYQQSWCEMAGLRQQLDVAGSRATVESPLVLLAAFATHAQFPFTRSSMVFPLLERPLASADHPYVAGPDVLEAHGSELLEAEVAPWRALWQQGATLCCWLAPGGRGQLVLVPRRHETGEATLQAGPHGFDVGGGSVSPWAVGGIEVEADGPFDGGELTWRMANGASGRRRFGPGVATGAKWSHEVDLMDDGSFLLDGTLGGVLQFAATLTPPAGARVTGLRVLPPPAPPPLSAPLRGAVVALRDLAARLPWSSLPAAAEPGTAAAVLMSKSFVYRIRCEPGKPTEVPERVRLRLVDLDRFARSDRTWYYLECRVAGRPWRSQIDWFERDQRR